MLTSIEELAVYLGEDPDDEANSDRLSALLTGVEKAVESFTGRSFCSEERTEYHSGNGRELLVLNHRPVTAISSLRVDPEGYAGQKAGGFTDAATLWTAGDDFYILRTDESEENGGLVKAMKSIDFGTRPGVWPCGDGNIKVVYTAGYIDIPEDIELAVLQIAANVNTAAENRMGGIYRSATLGKFAYRLLTGTEPAGNAEIGTPLQTLMNYMGDPW